jgi:hypothetical protein
LQWQVELGKGEEGVRVSSWPIFSDSMVDAQEGSLGKDEQSMGDSGNEENFESGKEFGDVEVSQYVEAPPVKVPSSKSSPSTEVLVSKMWNIANKPVILHQWQPGMQLLKLFMSSIPI